MWPLYDRALFLALERSTVVLAAADNNAINALVSRSKGRLARERLIQVPTSVDTSVFHPLPGPGVREVLGIPQNCVVFTTVGRIGPLKGWELLLDAFDEFLKRKGDALLIFVGDGEDRSVLQSEIESRNLASRVKITGFQKPAQVAGYLNASNVIVSGSRLEGWSVAMLEALACGKAIVSTEVSGAAAMIKPGRNGFIVTNRDPLNFAEAMHKALQLTDAEHVSTWIARDFDLARLRERLINAWPPLGKADRVEVDQRV